MNTLNTCAHISNHFQIAAFKQKWIEVFATDVQHARDAAMLIDKLQRRFPGCAINFDLEDCDKVLRIESSRVPVNIYAVIALITSNGFSISRLD